MSEKVNMTVTTGRRTRTETGIDTTVVAGRGIEIGTENRREIGIESAIGR